MGLPSTIQDVALYLLVCIISEHHFDVPDNMYTLKELITKDKFN